jgi:hypothetical protein
MTIQETLTPDQVRAIGIALNGGRSSGWRDRLAELTGASPYTIRSWCDQTSSASYRPCTGPAARLLRILIDLQTQGVSVDEYLRATMSQVPNT